MSGNDSAASIDPMELGDNAHCAVFRAVTRIPGALCSLIDATATPFYPIFCAIAEAGRVVG